MHNGLSSIEANSDSNGWTLFGLGDLAMFKLSKHFLTSSLVNNLLIDCWQSST